MLLANDATRMRPSCVAQTWGAPLTLSVPDAEYPKRGNRLEAHAGEKDGGTPKPTVEPHVRSRSER
jgi:hypothetical protein